MHSFEKNSNLGSNLEIGRDCMFSNNVIVHTSDSHIMKGVAIGDGSIIGFRSFVNKNIPECC